MSRLETSVETARLRNSLLAKNLYTPNNIYEIDNPAIIRAINTLADVVLPFKSFDITNTVLGRVIGPNTPIAQIGLVQLSKQLSQTIVSQGSAEVIPTFSIKNLFDKNPNTKFALRKIDYRITRDENQTKIGRLVETLTGLNLRKSPFTPQSTDADYIRNTGKGQLALLSDTLGRNFYRNSSITFYNTLENQGFPILSIREKPNGYYSDDAPFKSESDKVYGFYHNQVRAELRKNNSLYQEYGSSLYNNFSLNKEFIDAFGRTDNNFFTDEINYFGNRLTGHYEDNNQIIWGKTDVSENTLQIQKYSRDTEVTSEPISKFQSRIGLLKYTAQLVNAYGGNLIDQTRKKFYKKELINGKSDLVGFNGSALYKAPSNALPEFANKEGLRQHTVLDQYNRFAKAIRFNGNVVYGGNSNSVIYDRVIPNITPTPFGDSEKIINKKVMFSIENLAFQLTEDGYVVGLPEGVPNIQLPECEIGPNKGRLMWFAPYDINLEEQASARWEQVNFIGRNEPMYTYGFSERTATLSFKLIIDYPPQVKGFTTNKEFADFFAFGGQAVPKESNNLSDKEKQRNDIIKRIEELKEKNQLINYKNFNYKDINAYFPNDIPKKDYNPQSSFQTDVLDKKYEIGNSQGTQTIYTYRAYTGINTIFVEIKYNDIIIRTNQYPSPPYTIQTALEDAENTGKLIGHCNEITGDCYPQASEPTPYATKDDKLNQSLVNDINSIIQRIKDDGTIGSLEIVFEGNASKLYIDESKEFDYNTELSERRAIALKNYFEQKFKEVNGGKSMEELGASVIILPNGSFFAPESTRSPSSINLPESKRSRYVRIRFNNKGTTEQDNTNNQPNPNQDEINQLIKDKDALDKAISKMKLEKKYPSNCKFNPFTIEDGQVKGFDYISQNKFVPVFYSQTPEDFHKRLTFLQQCVRQGAPMRLKNKDDKGNDLSSKNSSFGLQPVCILRIGDFFHTKVIIDSINFNYSDAPWDINPEGMGMQFMICDISISMKVIGGQSLKGPIDVLQNAIGFNYYANSTYYDRGVYALSKWYEDKQYTNDNKKNTKTN